MENENLNADLEFYRIKVNEMADNEISDFIPNTGVERSIIIFNNIVRTSESSISLYVKYLQNQVSDDMNVLNQLESFLLKPQSKLKIISFNVLDNKSKLYSIFNRFKNKVEIYTLKPEMKYKFEQMNSFIIGDSNKFRYEEDFQNRKAICSFNNSPISEKLMDLFNKITSNSNQINLI